MQGELEESSGAPVQASEPYEEEEAEEEEEEEESEHDDEDELILDTE